MDEADEFDCNPCCCIRVKTGTFLIAVIDTLYAFAYVGRIQVLKDSEKEDAEFYPKEGLPSQNGATGFLNNNMLSINYYLIGASGVLLFISLLLMNRGPTFTKWILYFWLLIRTAMFLILLVIANFMLQSTSYLHKTYGIELLLDIGVHIYFYVVILTFTKLVRAMTRNNMLGTFRKKKNKLIFELAKPRFDIPSLTNINNATMYEFTPHMYLHNMKASNQPVGSGVQPKTISKHMGQMMATKRLSTVGLKNESRIRKSLLPAGRNVPPSTERASDPHRFRNLAKSIAAMSGKRKLATFASVVQAATAAHKAGLLKAINRGDAVHPSISMGVPSRSKVAPENFHPAPKIPMLFSSGSTSSMASTVPRTKSRGSVRIAVEERRPTIGITDPRFGKNVKQVYPDNKYIMMVQKDNDDKSKK